MEKFKNRYRIPSARAPWWDYSWRGRYFITICTAQHECIFGKIRDGHMQPSPMGEIVLREWEQSFQIRAELFCDAFVLMPNHLHAIVRIEYPDPTTFVERRTAVRLYNKRQRPQTWELPIVLPDPFHHLWRDSNHLQPNALTNFAIRPKYPCGNPVFMTTSSATRMNTIGLQIISEPIPKNGKMIHSLNRKCYERHRQKRT